jgi:hypothetical protein
MTDDNAPWFSPKHQPAGIPRQSYAGEEVWRLHDRTGQIRAKSMIRRTWRLDSMCSCCSTGSLVLPQQPDLAIE